MRLMVVAAGLLLGAAAPAPADEAFDACKAAGGDEASCGAQWIGREQAGLDAIWQELIGLTEGKVNASLVAEQKAWQAFRDASCAFKLDDGFGEAGGYYACRAEVIAARAASARRLSQIHRQLTRPLTACRRSRFPAPDADSICNNLCTGPVRKMAALSPFDMQPLASMTV